MFWFNVLAVLAFCHQIHGMAAVERKDSVVARQSMQQLHTISHQRIRDENEVDRLLKLTPNAITAERQKYNTYEGSLLRQYLSKNCLKGLEKFWTVISDSTKCINNAESAARHKYADLLEKFNPLRVDSRFRCMKDEETCRHCAIQKNIVCMEGVVIKAEKERLSHREELVVIKRNNYAVLEKFTADSDKCKRDLTSGYTAARKECDLSTRSFSAVPEDAPAEHTFSPNDFQAEGAEEAE